MNSTELEQYLADPNKIPISPSVHKNVSLNSQAPKEDDVLSNFDLLDRIADVPDRVEKSRLIYDN